MWDVADAKLLRTFAGSTHDGFVSSLSSSSNGLYAVSSSPSERSFTVWDAQIGTSIMTQQYFDNPISVAAMGPDGHFIAAAGISGVITFWDWTKGTSLRDLKAHSAKVNAVSISADGRHLVSASEDRSVKIWELPSGKYVRALSGHADSVKTLAISSDGRKIASASADNAIIIWDMASGARLQTLNSKSGDMTGVTFSPDGRRVMAGMSDGAVRIWDATSGALLASYLDLGPEAGAVIHDDGSFWTDAGGLAKLRLSKGAETIPLPDDYVAAFLRQGPAGQDSSATAK
jgi:WD40 repeat protein